MILLAFLIGTRALLHGYRQHHGRIFPLVLFTGGILLLAAKQIWHVYELRILPFAVILIVGAHLVNYRMSRPAEENADETWSVSELAKADHETAVRSEDQAA
jgi:hypothetical protein